MKWGGGCIEVSQDPDSIRTKKQIKTVNYNWETQNCIIYMRFEPKTDLKPSLNWKFSNPNSDNLRNTNEIQS